MKNTCESCLYHEPLGCVHREHTGEECVDKMGWMEKEEKSCDTCYNKTVDSEHFGCSRAGAGMCGNNRSGYVKKESKVESKPEKEYSEKRGEILAKFPLNTFNPLIVDLEHLAFVEGKEEGKRQEGERIEEEVIKLNAYPNTTDKKIKKADVLNIIKSK